MTADGSKLPKNNGFLKNGPAGGNDPAQRADSPGSRLARISDHVPLPGRAREIGDLVDVVRALPDVRCDKVAAIRKAIESGTYVVDAAKVAQRMIDEIRCQRPGPGLTEKRQPQ